MVRRKVLGETEQLVQVIGEATRSLESIAQELAQTGTPPAPPDVVKEEEWSELEPPTHIARRLAGAGRTAAELANSILSSPNIKLATAHVSGISDDATARQNIVDTAAGQPARRSSYNTAPGGTVRLDPSMLGGLLSLAEVYSFHVSELCGGEHSRTSRHYRGVAADINVIDGRPVSASHPEQNAFRARCHDLGATEVLGPGDAGHSTHIHSGWPAPHELVRGVAPRALEQEETSLEVAPVLGDARFLASNGLPATEDDQEILRELGKRLSLTWAVERLIDLRNERYPDSRPRYWGIVDFDLHSAKPRLFVLDVISKSFSSYLCAHGRGSEGKTDDGFADVFSNKSGSNASSLGIYRCAETYDGKNGYSLRLDGLESTNSKARSRKIVMHGADYVSPEFIEKYGRIGRSDGCPALDHKYSSVVIDQLKQGSFLIHWKAP
jgi:hypothetical protein